MMKGYSLEPVSSDWRAHYVFSCADAMCCGPGSSTDAPFEVMGWDGYAVDVLGNAVERS